MRIRATGAVLSLIAAGAVAGTARADSVSDFYSGKDVTILVGYGAGGGYDVTTRLFANQAGAWATIRWQRSSPL
jgi:tripartite-type tricarboxylate transporter receptor subunit TctC